MYEARRSCFTVSRLSGHDGPTHSREFIRPPRVRQNSQDPNSAKRLVECLGIGGHLEYAQQTTLDYEHSPGRTYSLSAATFQEQSDSLSSKLSTPTTYVPSSPTVHCHVEASRSRSVKNYSIRVESRWIPNMIHSRRRTYLSRRSPKHTMGLK